MSVVVSAPPSPYKGLAPFEDSDLDALLFFGRERESEVIAANLMAARLTVLYGPSGVGKSSVLRAGVAHRLRQEREAEVVVFSTWTGDPVATLIESVGGTGESLVDALADAADRAGGDLYVILDQFEECFLYHRRGGAFAAQLAEVVRRAGLRVNVLIGMREDSLARLDALKASIPNLLTNRLRLERLDRAAGMAAIVGPIGRYNELVAPDERVEIEAELEDAILDEVTAGRVELSVAGRGVAVGGADENRIEAPYLQLVLSRLWDVEAERGSPVLRLATLRELGGAEHIVQDHLERAMAELSPREKGAAAAMYNFLVTPSGTKIAHGVRDLAGYADVDEREASNVLRRLTDERIVRVSSENGAAARYEIYHDVLADAVLAWRNRYAAERAARAAERRRKRALYLAAVALIGLVLVGAIAIFALVERSHSQADARRARARELAADATSQLKIDPQKSVRLALEAAQLEPGPQEEDALRDALIADRLRSVLPAGGPVGVAAFDPTGQQLVSGSRDGKVRVYRRGANRPDHVFDHGGPVAAAAFSSDGKHLLAAGLNGVAHIWRLGDEVELQRLDAGGPVRSALFGRSDDIVVTLARNGRIRVWHARSGRLLRSFRVRGKALPQSGALDPEARLLVTQGFDRFARVYSLTTGRLIRTLPQRGFIRSVAFSHDGRLVLTAGYEGTARLWNSRTWRLIREFRGPERSALAGAVISRNGDLVGAASNDGTARVWETATGFQQAIMIGHPYQVTHVAFNPSGDALVTGSSDGTVRVWAADGRLISVLAGHTQPVTAVSFSPDGRLVVTASDDGTARIWDPGSQSDIRLLARAPIPSALAVGADGRHVLVGDTAGFARVLRVTRGRVLQTVKAAKPVTAVAFGQGRPLVATRPAGSIAYSAPAHLTAVGREDGSVVVKSVRGPGQYVLHPRDGAVGALAFSPDGKLLATGGANGTARLWDARTGRLLRTLSRHTLAITSVAFSPNGKLVLTASLDKDARLWSVDTGAGVHLLRWHFGPIGGASFSPDGRWVVTAGPGAAGVGLVATGQRVGFVRGHLKPLVGAVFAGTNGRLIITASKDGTIGTYDCYFCGNIDELIALAQRRLAAR
jgi:WD40 repeat protein